MSTTNNTDHFELRINVEEKETMERAENKAQSDINQLKTIVLSNRDRDLFLSALENATPSTGSLQQAFSCFRQKYEQS